MQAARVTRLFAGLRRRRWPGLQFFVLASLALVGCSRPASASATSTPESATPTPTAALTAGPAPITYGYQVVNAWPHDPTAFTQGLIYLKGILFESTGLYGKSSLRKVDLETGKVRQIQAIPAEIFGEGMTLLNDQVFVITWQSHKAFVYDPQSFTVQKEFSYEGEGWGLTHDGHSLIMSDGTDVIRFRDPATFQVTRSLSVTSNGRPVKMLNELEYIKGEIYANVWQTNFVVRIDPASGRVLSVIDFSGLLAPQEYTRNTDVLNGIAYDANGDRLFVTGKNWPKLFEVQIKSK